jgi:hypothetical protein
MKHPTRFFILTSAALALVIIGIYAIGAPDTEPQDQKDPPVPVKAGETPAQQTPASMDERTVQISEAEAEAVKEFDKKLAEYAALRQELESNLDPLDDQATPAEIDEHRNALRAQIKTARVGAKPGSFFNPGMLALIKRVCAVKVTGDGAVKSTIMDENPGKLPDVHINDRYPDGIPVTTMPAQLLEVLPSTSDFVEYRFIGKRLVLLDASAGVVLDITPDVLP